MVVDCHTRIWESPDQIGLGDAVFPLRGQPGLRPLAPDQRWPDASMGSHQQASEPVDHSFVMGFKSRYLGVEIPSAHVAAYVKQYPDKLIGVAGIDPTNLPDALADLERAHGELGMKAITVSPSAQDFHPADSRAMQVFAEAARLKMPVLVDHGIHFGAHSKMEFGRPVLLDEVARELPQLKLVIAHMGYPWIDETLVLLGKHANVFADISALMHRPWQAYNAIISAYQFGVIDKLLFGSDFPYALATSAIESLYRINQIVTGTNLPTVPRPYLAAIVERETLALLGIQTPTPPRKRDEVDDELLDATDA